MKICLANTNLLTFFFRLFTLIMLPKPVPYIVNIGFLNQKLSNKYSQNKTPFQSGLQPGRKERQGPELSTRSQDPVSPELLVPGPPQRGPGRSHLPSAARPCCSPPARRSKPRPRKEAPPRPSRRSGRVRPSGPQRPAPPRRPAPSWEPAHTQPHRPSPSRQDGSRLGPNQLERQIVAVPHPQGG